MLIYLLETARRKKEKDKQRLLEWLSPLQFEHTYDKKCCEHLAGTGSWLLESELYNSWKSSEKSDLLWIKGKPGCGKSVLAAVVITDLRLHMESTVALAYAFCRKDDKSLQEPTDIIGALGKQINRQSSDMNSILESNFQASQQGEKPSLRVIRTVLDSGITHFERTFLVIDALDECSNTLELAHHLLDLVRETVGSFVKVVVFSRPDYVLEQNLTSFKLIQPDHGANAQDLSAYIETFISGDSAKALNQQIREECIAKAEGMFLWVKLLKQNFQETPLLPKQKLKRIRDMSAGLENLYNGMLRDMLNQPEDVRSTAIDVLIWVTNARWPFSVPEMLEAVADYTDATTVRQASKHTNPEHLVAICKNLVQIDKDGYFRLCHESLRNHLEKQTEDENVSVAKYQQKTRNSNERLAMICLNYLLLENFECGPVRSIGKLRAMIKMCPFLDYAATFWTQHVTLEVEVVLHDLVLKLMRSSPRRELLMQILVTRPADGSWIFPGSSNPLHILSLYGLKRTAETLPDLVTLLQEVDGSGKTCLDYALMGRHHDMSLWLIEQIQLTQGQLRDREKIYAIHVSAGLGWITVLEKLISDEERLIDSTQKEGPTPLSRACILGEHNIAKILIERGANVNLKDGDGNTPLINATYHVHASLVELLLKNGADPNGSNTATFTPLHHAAGNDNERIAQALLEAGADPMATAPLEDHWTPLHVAASLDSIHVITALHRMHAKFDMRSDHGHTALHIASTHGFIRSVELLLNLGCPKDEFNSGKRTALAMAARSGFGETVRTLLEAGCAVDAIDAEGETSIHAAAFSGKTSILRCIISTLPVEKRLALLNKRSKVGLTPLHKAVVSGNTNVVRFLLREGADASAKDIDAWTPLHYAAYYGHKAISLPLLRNNQDPNPRTQSGESPLHIAARANRADFIIQFFRDCFEIGLSIESNAQDESKVTALHNAARVGFVELAGFLLEKGAVSLPDSNGDYPIHLAAWFGSDSIVEKLMNHDGGSEKGLNGQTPLLCAAWEGHLGCVKLLASSPDFASKSLTEVDDTKNTPAVAALTNRHVEVANYILDHSVDATVVNQDGDNLLHMAAFVGDLSIVKRLLAVGCDGSACNKYKETPLHNAVKMNDIDMIDALLARGFNTSDAKDHLGFNCIIHAAQKGNLEILQKLEDLGSVLWTRDSFDFSTAHAAADGGHCEVLEYLEHRGERLDLLDSERGSPLFLELQEATQWQRRIFLRASHTT